MTKPFLTIEKQIQLLKSRDLIINDDEEALHLFSLHSYYSVINGYKDIFLCPQKSEYYKEDRFKENVNLKDIIHLFRLDIEFRKEILSILEVVESILSNNIAYILGERYGHRKEDYLIKDNFQKGRRIKIWKNNKIVGHELEIDKLFRRLHRCYNSYEHPMRHYRENHKDIPPWVLVKGLTFRNLYYIYKLFRYRDKNYLISRCLGIDEESVDKDLKEFFNKALDLMIYYRNWAAHGNRIFSHKTRTKLSYYKPVYKSVGLCKDDYAKGIGVNDLFALSIAVRFFLRIDKVQATTYHVLITYYLRDYAEKNPEYYNLVLEAMGFPDNHHELIVGYKEEELSYAI